MKRGRQLGPKCVPYTYFNMSTRFIDKKYVINIVENQVRRLLEGGVYSKKYGSCANNSYK
jgi:hypothetical protein